VTCSYCGTELPSGAMFCGECGQSTGARPAHPGPDQPETALESETKSEPEPATDIAPAPGSDATQGSSLEPEVIDLTGDDVVCTQCGQRFEESDIFCPECGFVRAHLGSARGPNDTVAYDPFPWGLPRSTERASAHVHVPSAPPDSVSVTEAPEPAHPRLVTAIPVDREAAAPLESAHPETGPGSEFDFVDVEKTRILSRSARGERFVLQFSTGESVTVFGTGMVGRHPVSEPGEFFDTFVAIVDPGKSVSKTHLEFGQDGGHFWVTDRFSGNGTVTREPDSQPIRCDPGKRYRIVRGTRVNIGEQFFIVS
jgi:Double zinc ribbon/FHA domain